MNRVPRPTSTVPSLTARRMSKRLWLSVAALGALASPALAQDAPIELDAVTLESQAGAGAKTAGGLTTQGYVAKAGTTATKTDTPLIKVPQSVSVVSREQLDDRNVQTLNQALTYTPGVRIGAFGYDPRFDAFTIRGFDVTYTGIFRDGLKEQNGNFSIFKTEPYGLEGIAVLKGPSSALYGAGSPGGVVDLVTKRPTEAPVYEVGAQVGNHNRRQAQFDVGGPVDANGNFLYRLTGLVRESDTDIMSNPDDKVYIAPAFTLQSDDRNTKFTFLSEYSRITTGGNASFFNQDGRRTDLESGDRRGGDFVQKQGRVGYEFEHRFDETVTVRQKFRYAHIDADVKYVQIDGIADDGLTANRSAWRITDDLDSVTVDNQAQFDFDTGPVKHTVLGGLDYSWVNVTDKIGANYDPTDVPPLDLVDLNYGEQDITGVSVYNFADSRTKQDQTGLYLQDQMEFNNFVLTAGGRYTWLSRSDLDKFTDTETEQDDEKFTGRVGLSYLTDWGIAPYVSYATSFAPTIGRGFDGTPFKPTEGEQTEVGVKYVPEGVNASVNAALFDITQTNGVSTDPDNAGFSIQRGEVRSRGFELEGTAGFDNGFSLIAAYTYMDLEITEGDNEGNTPSSSPAHQLSLWGNYAVQSGALAGLELGAGVRVFGESFEADDNDTGGKNDAKALFDLALGYDVKETGTGFDGMKAQLNVTNVFDKTDDTCASSYCYRDEGRSIIGSLTYKF